MFLKQRFYDNMKKVMNMRDSGRTIKAKAIGYDEFGKGIIKEGSESIGIFNLISGETAEIRISRNGKYTYTSIQKIIEKSPLRVNPPCKVYNQCGSCQLQHINYTEQLKLKTDYVKNAFLAYGIIVEPRKIIGMEQPYRYRNKNQFGYGYDETGQIVVGLYEEYSHKIVPVMDCLIQDEITNTIFNSVKDIMKKMKIMPYKEDAKRGIVRYVVIKRGFSTNQTLVTIVTTVESFPGKSEFYQAIKEANPTINTMVQNVNSRQTSVILGDVEKVIYGKGTIEDHLCGLKFNISSKSFYQINPKQTEKLYNKVVEYAALTGNEVVLDTYSGIGTIGLILAKNAKEVYSAELNKDAHNNAIQNAKLNNIKNVHFFNEDATHFIQGLAKEKIKVDVVVMDPTRSGSTPEFVNALGQLKPKKIVYVSCEPATQARDIAKIIKKGYVIQEITPIDMFCQTYHVETISLLSLK